MNFYPGTIVLDSYLNFILSKNFLMIDLIPRKLDRKPRATFTTFLLYSVEYFITFMYGYLIYLYDSLPHSLKSAICTLCAKVPYSLGVIDNRSYVLE